MNRWRLKRTVRTVLSVLLCCLLVWQTVEASALAAEPTSAGEPETVSAEPEDLNLTPEAAEPEEEAEPRAPARVLAENDERREARQALLYERRLVPRRAVRRPRPF